MRCLLLIGLMLVAQSTLALRYGATAKTSTWHYQGDETFCQLEHTVPRYGTVVFQQLSGEPMQLRIKANHYRQPFNLAEIEVWPTPWQQESMPEKVMSLSLSQQAGEIHIEQSLARKLFRDLEQGRMPVLGYKGQANDRVNVRVLPVGFLETSNHFLTCQNELLEIRQRDINNMVLLFKEPDQPIIQKERQLLKNIGEYLKASDKYRIWIHDHLRGALGEEQIKRYKDRKAVITKALTRYVAYTQFFDSDLVDPDDEPELDMLKELTPLHLYLFDAGVIRGVNFETDKYKIAGRNQKKLTLFANYYNGTQKGKKLKIEGHTDDVYTQVYNLGLSQRRADAAYLFLASKQVPTKQITISFFGENQPMADNETEEGQAQNRRSVFQLIENESLLPVPLSQFPLIID